VRELLISFLEKGKKKRKAAWAELGEPRCSRSFQQEGKRTPQRLESPPARTEKKKKRNRKKKPGDPVPRSWLSRRKGEGPAGRQLPTGAQFLLLFKERREGGSRGRPARPIPPSGKKKKERGGQGSSAFCPIFSPKKKERKKRERGRALLAWKKKKKKKRRRRSGARPRGAFFTFFPEREGGGRKKRPRTVPLRGKRGKKKS